MGNTELAALVALVAGAGYMISQKPLKAPAEVEEDVVETFYYQLRSRYMTLSEYVVPRLENPPGVSLGTQRDIQQMLEDAQRFDDNEIRGKQGREDMHRTIQEIIDQCERWLQVNAELGGMGESGGGGRRSQREGKLWQLCRARKFQPLCPL